jgi:hypothetical protein
MEIKEGGGGGGGMFVKKETIDDGFGWIHVVCIYGYRLGFAYGQASLLG